MPSLGPRREDVRTDPADGDEAPHLGRLMDRVVDADGAAHRIADDVNGVQTQRVDEGAHGTECGDHRVAAEVVADPESGEFQHEAAEMLGEGAQNAAEIAPARHTGTGAVQEQQGSARARFVIAKNTRLGRYLAKRAVVGQFRCHHRSRHRQLGHTSDWHRDIRRRSHGPGERAMSDDGIHSFTFTPDDGVPPAVAPFAHATAAGPTLYVTGQMPTDATGSWSGADVATQTDQVLRNLVRVTELCGGELADVVSVRAYLIDWNDYAAFNAAYAAWFPEPAAVAHLRRGHRAGGRGARRDRLGVLAKRRLGRQPALERRAFCRRGGVERRRRGQIQVDDHGFECRAPAFVIRALRVRGDLVHQPVAELVPWQAELVDEGDRDRQRARLPRRIEDELAVVAGQRCVVERRIGHSRCTPIIESRVTIPASCSSDMSSVPSGRIGSTR